MHVGNDTAIAHHMLAQSGSYQSFVPINYTSYLPLRACTKQSNGLPINCTTTNIVTIILFVIVYLSHAMSCISDYSTCASITNLGKFMWGERLINFGTQPGCLTTATDALHAVTLTILRRLSHSVY